MACLITTGRKTACKDKIGGIYKVWFANFGTINPTIDANGIITNFATGSTIYEYELKGVSKLSQEIISDASAGTTSVTQTLTLDLQGGDAVTNNQIKLLAYGRPQVIVQDNTGAAWLAGTLRGMDVTSGILDFGDSIEAKYGYTLTMVGKENEYANWLSGSTIANAFAGMTNSPTIVTGS